VLVNIDPHSTAAELEHQLRDCGAKAIVVYESQAYVLEKVLKNTPVEHIVLAALGEMHSFFKRLLLRFSAGRTKKRVPPFKLAGATAFKKTLTLGRNKELRQVNVTRDDLAFLHYTRTGTGTAKGVMLTHGNVVANVQQVAVCLGPNVEEGNDIAITALPMNHIVCLTANVLLSIRQGGHCLLITDPNKLKAVVKALHSVPFTAISGTGAFFDALLNEPGLGKVDFSCVKRVLGDGAAIEPAQADRWYAATGTRFSRVYGLAEASPLMCFNPLAEANDACIGLPLPATEVTIRDSAFIELPVGQEGELCVKGPQVMRGYWSKPRETADVLTQDGWLKTGDVAYKDENGHFYLAGSKKLEAPGQ
jgi:long-chain acyl-CoA synthetase